MQFVGTSAHTLRASLEAIKKAATTTNSRIIDLFIVSAKVNSTCALGQFSQTIRGPDSMSKSEFYANILLSARGLISGEPNKIANLANIASLLHTEMNNWDGRNASGDEMPPAWSNWTGFYLMDDVNADGNGGKKGLVLGPFQGKPACIRIPVGRGVCGTAVSTGTTQIVRDVHAFPGHIACDSVSMSEIVVPIRDPASGDVLGVLDIDSPSIASFDNDDATGLEELVAFLASEIKW